jgi:hypothetical protein
VFFFISTVLNFASTVFFFVSIVYCVLPGRGQIQSWAHRSYKLSERSKAMSDL